MSFYPKSVHEASAQLDQFVLDLGVKSDEHLKRLHNKLEGGASSEVDLPVVFKQFKEGLVKLREREPTAGREEHAYLTQNIHSVDQKEPNTSNEAADAMTELEVYSEMADHMVAGHDTTSVSLAYVFRELSKHPEMQDHLAAELLNLSHLIKWPSEITEPPTPKEIDSLLYLNAVVMESLRLRSPVPGPQPRISPSVPNGSLLGPPDTTSHYTGIPLGVRVSAMSYALHRNPTVYPDPDTSNPGRWLTTAQGGQTTQDQMIEINRHFWAFGSGGRMCIGSHFALQVMKLIISAIYMNYRTEILDDDASEQLDGYFTYPKSGKIMLRFVKR